MMSDTSWTQQHIWLKMSSGIVARLASGSHLKALAQVWLHSQWVLCLRQNLEQFIIGQKEEAGKGQPLGLQVVRQTLQPNLSLKYGNGRGGEQCSCC